MIAAGAVGAAVIAAGAVVVGVVVTEFIPVTEPTLNWVGVKFDPEVPGRNCVLGT